MDVSINADSMLVSISIEGNELTTILASDLIPRNIFTEYLSRSILSVVAAYGSWSAGYGLPPLELQVASPRSYIQVVDSHATHLVCFSASICNPESTSSVQISEIATEDSALVLPPLMHNEVSSLHQ